MDVTPQLLREVEFRERLRGYHPDDVDDFLERVAIAVDDLLERLAAAERHAPVGPVAPAAERSAEPAATPVDDELRRTLVLAQRTADSVVAEARDEAARIVADAESTAARLRTEHAELQARVAQLHGWLDEARDVARTSLRDVLERLDHPVALPEPPEGWAAPVAEPAGEAEVATWTTPPGAPDHGPEVQDQADDGHDGDGEDPASQWADEPTGEHALVDLAGASDDQEGDDQPGHVDRASEQGAEEQPDPLADLSGPALHTGVADDPFFTELRRAVTDDDPLGPREDDPGVLDHLYADRGDEGDRDRRELVSSRFRIRRRR